VRNSARGIELVRVALTVSNRQRKEAEALRLRYRRRGIGVEPAAQ